MFIIAQEIIILITNNQIIKVIKFMKMKSHLLTFNQIMILNILLSQIFQ